MKKILFSLLLFIISLTVVGCSVVQNGNINTKLPTDVDVDSEEVYAYILLELKDKDDVKEDLNLPTKFKDIDLTWASSNESVLSSTGKVNRQDKDTKVVLTCSLVENGKEKSYDFVVTVKAKEPEPTPTPTPTPTIIEEVLSIEDVLNKEVNTHVITNGYVKAISGVSFILGDDKNDILVYIGPSFIIDIVIGDELKVEGRVRLRGAQDAAAARGGRDRQRLPERAHAPPAPEQSHGSALYKLRSARPLLQAL